MNTPYIKKIILREFCSSDNLEWELSEGVNILSGVNGSGKSTLVAALSWLFSARSHFNHHQKPFKEIVVEFEDGSRVSSLESELKCDNIDFITTFDSPLKSYDAIHKLSDGRVSSDLDWELYRVLGRYLRYQLMVGKMAISTLLDGGKKSDEVQQLANNKQQYFDIIDRLFASSGKHIDRTSDEIQFKRGDYIISPYDLSSGEKQLIIIITTALVQNRQNSILVLDEPEISLHHQWQRKLIETIVTINPNLQLIITTHSPALIMEGWMDRVTDISDISSQRVK